MLLRMSLELRICKSCSACSSSPKAKNSCLRSEEHTSELQSRENLVCRLLLEKKKEAWATASEQSSIARACFAVLRPALRIQIQAIEERERASLDGRAVRTAQSWRARCQHWWP